jgi:phage shock protein A
MGIFTRVRDIVGSNINSVLDKAENPEKLVKHMIREMEDTLVELKAACAGAMASAKKASRDMDGVNTQIRHWEDRAELAIERNRDELAREALTAKRHYQDDAETVQREVDQLEELVGQYKSDIIQIEDKLGQARERQRVLVRRFKHAVHKKRAQQDIRKFDTSQVFVKFEEFAQRLDRAEAEADLVNFGRGQHKSLEQDFSDLEKDDSIEAELKRLKDAKAKRQQTSPISVSA